MAPTVSILAQGGMGAPIAARLVAHGCEVRTILTGRSAASTERARKAGMKDVSADEFVAADFVLSITPPSEAMAVAKQLAGPLHVASRWPVYIDLNAVNPGTVLAIEKVVVATGSTFVDGSIIGGPPREGYDGPAIYLSGPAADRAADLKSYGLKLCVLNAPVGAASALKMCYGGITKGLIAVGSSMILAARRSGVADALRAEMAISQAGLLSGFSRSIPDMFAKAGRYVAEMEEISNFVAADGVAEGEIYAAIARLYDRLGCDFVHEQKDIAPLRQFFDEAR